MKILILTLATLFFVSACSKEQVSDYVKENHSMTDEKEKSK